MMIQPEDVIGKHARRSLAGNAPLSTQDVTAVTMMFVGAGSWSVLFWSRL